MNEAPPRPKRRYSRISLSEAQTIANEWQSSGLSRAAFARSKGLDVKLVYRCLDRVGLKQPRPSSAPSFVPVAHLSPTHTPLADARDQLSWHLPHDCGRVTGSASEMAYLMRLYLEYGRSVS